MTSNQLAHGRDWTGFDPSGWWLTEKYDGCRALWDGEKFVSRNGNVFNAPAWFKSGLPAWPLDGELWGGYGQMHEAVSIARTIDAGARWRAMMFLAFDCPEAAGNYSVRLASAAEALQGCQFARAVEADICRDVEHLRVEFHAVKSRGGEGLVLHHPRKAYSPGRSQGCISKVKKLPR